MDRGKRFRWRRKAAGDYRYGPYRVRLRRGWWYVHCEHETEVAWVSVDLAPTLRQAKRIVERDAARRRLAGAL
jgi:hypothetical protein